MLAFLLFFLHAAVRVALGVPIALLWVAPAFDGDVIHFKDGMRTLCHGNAWEEKDEVHCEYGGGLLIYPKNDVSRIEKVSSAENAAASKNVDGPEPIPSQPAVAASPPPPPSALGAYPKPPSGILFYDPRRNKKYWSSATAQHKSYSDALSALASEFNRSASWIEENMGESNDLREIRDILAVRSKMSAPGAPDDRDHGAAERVEFYNPRRPKKYWTSSSAQHDTLDQAIEALAAEFEKPAAWIEAHMGEINDVEQIRQSLKHALAAGTGK